MDGIRVDLTVDTSGTCCPTPLLEVTRAARRMKPGEVLELIATDIGSRMDIPLWCSRTGNELLAQEERAGVLHYFIRKRR
ncbi:MAG: sulfurtransferase TusA family protein [Gammaproteobacteria bacterium]|nr:sulfurtransferase TusA family protein [Gammaproteobacteria bacterium]